MAEPWIRVHANLADKPVVWRLIESLGVSQHEAVGLLVTFWGKVSQHAANGIISTIPDAQLEVWAQWRGKRGRFAAFVRESHMDADGRVNEWDEYAGKLEGRREQERLRKQRERERTSRGRHADGTPDGGSTSLPTIRNDTKRTDVVDDPDKSLSLDSLTALAITVCANQAITERWGEQTNTLTQGASADLAEVLEKAGVEWAVVRSSIWQQCRDVKRGTPPSGVNYFRPGIETAWQQELARRAARESGERPPPIAARTGSFSRRDTKAGNAGAQMVANILGGGRD